MPITQNSRNSDVNMVRTYQFVRKFTSEGSSSTSHKIVAEHKKTSPWRKLRELNSAIQIAQFNLREPKTSRTTYGTAPKDPQPQPLQARKLFMRWRAELEKYTDVHPVFNRDPPLKVTKPKAFEFRRLSKGKNSPNKGIPPAIKDSKDAKNEEIRVAKTSMSHRRNLDAYDRAYGVSPRPVEDHQKQQHK